LTSYKPIPSSPLLSRNTTLLGLSSITLISYLVLPKESHPPNITLSVHPPQNILFGKLQGIRYGFAEIKNTGGVLEQHLGYVAFDGQALYNVTTAFDPDAITGKFAELENMAVFEPYLSATIADLKLP
jgi:hypothetical protein